MPDYIVKSHIDTFLKTDTLASARTSLEVPRTSDFQSLCSTVQASSANWSSNYTTTNSNSANWSSVYTTVCATSASWAAGGTNLATVTNYLSTNNVLLSSAVVSNLTGANVFATTLNTVKPQTIYQGKVLSVTIGNSLTANLQREGRMTMVAVTPGTNCVLNLSATQTNSFLEGDAVGIWSTSTNRLSVTYTPFGGSPISITSFIGGGGYNSGSISLEFINNTFVTKPLADHNISGVAAELKIESIQPQDPGTPFTTVGRGSFVHGLTLQGGHPKFTNGSDHFHLIQNGAGGGYQTINGGYTYTPQRITQHTQAFRGPEVTAPIVAAYGASLTANQIAPPYTVDPVSDSNYLAVWTSSYNTSLTVGKIIYFSVSPTGIDNESLRKIGFTAASFPAKIISVNDTGTAQSNADIPAGQALPATATKHFRLQPFNLSIDNWLGATTTRASLVPAFTNSVINTAEVIRLPGDPLLVPDSQIISLSSKGGYNTVSMRNSCELVFNTANTPLLSAKLPFLYESLPVIVLLSDSRDLSAINYNGLTPDSEKRQYGMVRGANGEIIPSTRNYSQQSYDGYIYRSSPTEVIIRLGQQRGTEESRLQKFATPNIEFFLDRPGITNGTFSLTTPPNGLSSVDLNGYIVNNISPAFRNNKFGIWSSNGVNYTLPPIMKSGLEFASFAPISSSDLQLYVYAGNKDPVHRPVAGLQLFSYERYPTTQSELKESGGVVSRFALGPSCEGFDRDTAVVGFGSTAYHYRSMAIGHRVETLSAQEIAIGIDESVLRVGLSSLSISPAMLSTNGVDTFLKIKRDNGPMYGLKLQPL
jgi:hypothetical protein